MYYLLDYYSFFFLLIIVIKSFEKLFEKENCEWNEWI